MAKDTRIFRVTKSKYRGEKIDYCTRTAVSGMFGTSLYSSQAGRPDILKVEAANAEATSGWTDVTEEFRAPAAERSVRCQYHRTYTGVRKPTISTYAPDMAERYWRGCKCWTIYAVKHPDYPTHSDFCGKLSVDPEKCDCKAVKKIFG